MKKIVSILLVFSILFAFAACSKNKGPMDESTSINSTDSETAKNSIEDTTKKEEEGVSSHSVPQISSSNEYKTLCINGTVMDLPVKYSDFVAALDGYLLAKWEDANQMLASGEHQVVSFDRDNYTTMYVSVLNNEKETKKITECEVDGFVVTGGDNERKNPDIQVLGFSVDDKITAEELKKKFGEPECENSQSLLSGTLNYTQLTWDVPINDAWEYEIDFTLDNNTETINSINVLVLNVN